MFPATLKYPPLSLSLDGRYCIIQYVRWIYRQPEREHCLDIRRLFVRSIISFPQLNSTAAAAAKKSHTKRENNSAIEFEVIENRFVIKWQVACSIETHSQLFLWFLCFRNWRKFFLNSSFSLSSHWKWQVLETIFITVKWRYWWPSFWKCKRYHPDFWREQI